jgi:hypothetical protein
VNRLVFIPVFAFVIVVWIGWGIWFVMKAYNRTVRGGGGHATRTTAPGDVKQLETLSMSNIMYRDLSFWTWTTPTTGLWLTRSGAQ